MKKLFIVMLVLLFLCPAAMAKKVGDVDVAESITVGGQALSLNGSGQRIKKVAFFKIHVYAAGLYLQAKSADAQSIIDTDAPMAIRLYITTNKASKEKLTDAWTEGFERATGGNTDAIKGEIAKFNALFKKNPKDGDMYEIAYVPGQGITLAMNGESQGAAIPGMEFKKSVFGIWLTKDIDDDDLSKLKAGLLGN
ncbi:MAG: chalcone isomerase family protein [Desulfosalsimonadaceae bacterium]